MRAGPNEGTNSSVCPALSPSFDGIAAYPLAVLFLARIARRRFAIYPARSLITSVDPAKYVLVPLDHRHLIQTAQRKTADPLPAARIVDRSPHAKPPAEPA